MNSGQTYPVPYSSPLTAREDRKLILSVDDELGVLFSRYKLLAAAGYAVLSASDGVQALGIFSREKIDLVVLDYNLPEMNGGLVAEAMKANDPHIPIVMVTTAHVPSDYLFLCDGHVRKGDGPEPLLHTVRQILFPSIPPETDHSRKAS